MKKPRKSDDKYILLGAVFIGLGFFFDVITSLIQFIFFFLVLPEQTYDLTVKGFDLPLQSILIIFGVFVSTVKLWGPIVFRRK